MNMRPAQDIATRLRLRLSTLHVASRKGASAAVMAGLLFAAPTVKQKVATIAARVDAVVGVAAVDLDTGATFTLRGDAPFPMASVVKFPVAIEVMHRVDAGTMRLDQRYTLAPADFSPGHSPIRDAAKGKAVTLTLRELVRAAVSDSDNTAGDYLIRLVTPAAVNARMKALNTSGIRVDRTERQIIETLGTPAGVARYAADERDTATPLALTALFGVFAKHRAGLTPGSYEFLDQCLTAGGNPARLGRLLPRGSKVAHKTGSMPGTLNDAGVITSPDGRHHIAIAVLTKEGAKSAEEARNRVIAEIARVIFDAMTRRR